MIFRKHKRITHVIFDSEEEFREHYPNEELLSWGHIPKSISNHGRGIRPNKAQRWGQPEGTEFTDREAKEFRIKAKENRDKGYCFDGRVYSIARFYELLNSGRSNPIISISGYWIKGSDNSVQQCLGLREFRHNSGKPHLTIIVMVTPMGYFPLYETTVMDKKYRGTCFTSSHKPKLSKRQKEFMLTMVVSRDVRFAFQKVYPYHYEKMKGNFNSILLYLRRKILTDLFMQELTKLVDETREVKAYANEHGGSLKEMAQVLIDLAHTAKDEKAKIMAAKEVINLHKDADAKQPKVTIINHLSSPPSPTQQVNAEVVEPERLEDARGTE